MALGEFRDDLYYRLNVLNIYLPPLRERREDIPLLVRRFIRELARAHDRTFRGITPEAMQRLVTAPWPGNVRQLRNLIESMVVLAPGAEIRAADIPPDILDGPPGSLLPVRLGGALREAPATSAGTSWSSSSGACSTSSSRSRSSAAGWTSSPQRVQVIELADHSTVADVLPDERRGRRGATRWSTGAG